MTFKHLWIFLFVTAYLPINIRADSVKNKECTLIEKVRQPWRSFQKKYKNSTVQILCRGSKTNTRLPCAVPSEQSSCGSGFFFNEKGEIFTNAHVVDQALALWILIPAFGKQLITVELVGSCPERDVAILRLPEKELAMVKEKLGEIPYLPLGDSDKIYASDEVLALGYPLGQESLKSTTGVISGPYKQYIQMSAPINPGSSGGPLLNINGEVVGINFAGFTEAQNVGYIIPINQVKVILPDLYKNKLLHKAVLGVFSQYADEHITEYLGNPQPGGCLVDEVVKNSPLYSAGVKSGDMIYEINGHRLDTYGLMNVPWSEDKVSIIDYASRLSLGQTIDLVVYRKGERLELSVPFEQIDRLPIRTVYPGYEKLDYEIFAGMVVMELTLNHVNEFAHVAPGLGRFNEMHNQEKPVLLITHIFSSSSLSRARTLMPGATLVEINEQEVHTLDDFRRAMKEGADQKYFVIRAADRMNNVSDNLLVVLPYEDALKQELQLSKNYHYPLSKTVTSLLQDKGLLPAAP